MDPSIRTGYLVLADITGYTLFLAASELPHAQLILREILGLIMKNLSPTLRIAEVEGDAIFAYVPDERLPRGETLLELIETTYVAFRDLRAAKQRMSTCACEACHAIPSLDLKFVVHHGEYVEQQYDAKIKPVGSSVNIAHRLLKNGVCDATGWRGYLLFSEDSLRAMQLEPNDMYHCSESYEHLGEINICSLDLDKRYLELNDARYKYISPPEAHVTTSHDVLGQPSLVWTWLNDPECRRAWWRGSDWHFDERPDGRTGQGASNHCSQSNFIEHVLDWRPFTYFTVRRKRGPLSLLETAELEPSANGTRITWNHQLEAPLPGWLLRKLCGFIVAKGMKLEDNAALLEKKLAEAVVEFQEEIDELS
jgi:hypothetical protein